jgi:hypothetical protein
MKAHLNNDVELKQMMKVIVLRLYEEFGYRKSYTGDDAVQDAMLELLVTSQTPNLVKQRGKGFVTSRHLYLLAKSRMKNSIQNSPRQTKAHDNLTFNLGHNDTHICVDARGEAVFDNITPDDEIELFDRTENSDEESEKHASNS